MHSLQSPWHAKPVQAATSSVSSPNLHYETGGRICLAVKSALEYIIDHQSELTDKQIFVCINAQCILRALEVEQYQSYSYMGINTSPLWMSIQKITRFCKKLVLHHVPAHVGLLGNELANEQARYAATAFTELEQEQVCALLSNLKSYLELQP